MSSDREERNNSDLKAEQEKYELERVAELTMIALELAAARMLHQNSLPLSDPMIEGYEIAGFNSPSLEVGGDYYDFLPYIDGRLGIVIADVSSKGTKAAMLAAILKNGLSKLAESGADPSFAIAALNRIVCDAFPAQGLFASLIFGVLTPESGLFRYCNAGHVAGVLVHADGTIDLLESNGTVVGLVEDYLTWELDEVLLKAGDMLALVTDSISEALNVEDHYFGNEQLARYLLENQGERCSELAVGLKERALDWMGPVDNNDDHTIVLIRRNGTVT